MLFRIGVTAIVVSFVPWLVIALLPLLGVSAGQGAALAGGAVLVAEVLFWGGVALAGKDTWRAVRARGWRRAPRELWRLLVQGRSDARHRGGEQSGDVSSGSPAGGARR